MIKDNGFCKDMAKSIVCLQDYIDMNDPMVQKARPKFKIGHIGSISGRFYGHKKPISFVYFLKRSGADYDFFKEIEEAENMKMLLEI